MRRRSRRAGDQVLARPRDLSGSDGVRRPAVKQPSTPAALSVKNAAYTKVGAGTFIQPKHTNTIRTSSSSSSSSDSRIAVRRGRGARRPTRNGIQTAQATAMFAAQTLRTRQAHHDASRENPVDQPRAGSRRHRHLRFCCDYEARQRARLRKMPSAISTAPATQSLVTAPPRLIATITIQAWQREGEVGIVREVLRDTGCG